MKKFFISAIVDGKRINVETDKDPLKWKKDHISRDVIITFWNENHEIIASESECLCPRVNMSSGNEGKTLYVITGGLGFIGKNFINNLYSSIPCEDFCVLNIDCVTYAADTKAMNDMNSWANYYHLNMNICDPFLTEYMRKVVGSYEAFKNIHVVHFAAESHVDNSIDSSSEFVKTNVVGTMNVMDSLRNIGISRHKNFNFVHISTDEVYGDLPSVDQTFYTDSLYNPSSPYSASKAASDHIVSSYIKTHGFKANIVHCSNNYGQGQNVEKLIPKAIYNITHGISIPLYGDPTKYYRNWIHTLDFCDGILMICQSYSSKKDIPTVINFGSDVIISNSDLVLLICESYVQLIQEGKIEDQYWIGGTKSFDRPDILYKEVVTHVKDRPAHDRVYNVCYKVANKHLGWFPKRNIRSTINQLILKEKGQA